MILEPRKMMKENNPGKRNRMAKMEKKNFKADSETERVQLGWNMVFVWNVRRIY